METDASITKEKKLAKKKMYDAEGGNESASYVYVSIYIYMRVCVCVHMNERQVLRYNPQYNISCLFHESTHIFNCIQIFVYFSMKSF